MTQSIIQKMFGNISINVLVTCSNLSLIVFMYYYNVSIMNNMLTLIPMCASMIYHISEVKHGLPGIYPLNKCSNELIWLDRISAVSACVYGAYTLYQTGNIDYTMCAIGLFGLVCLGVSEYDVVYMKLINNKLKIHVNKDVFLVSHSLWHISAFYLLAKILS